MLLPAGNVGGASAGLLTYRTLICHPTTRHSLPPQMLVWLGDFNYRIDGAYESVKERAIRNELGPLLELVGGGGRGGEGGPDARAAP